MKHLRKYNENIDNDIKNEVEYIRECFVEFFDNGATSRHSTYDEEHYLTIEIPKGNDNDGSMWINMGSSVKSQDNIIKDKIEENEKENDILNGILDSMEKVRMKYRVSYSYTKYKSAYQLEFTL